MWKHLYKAYQALSIKLGKSKFFLNTSKPTTLDCLVFGVLALHLYPPIPNPYLSKIIKGKYPNLVAFCDRMSVLLFPTSKLISTSTTAVMAVNRGWWINNFWSKWTSEEPLKVVNQKQIDEEEKAELRRRWVASFIGVTIFALWVVRQGIIKVETVGGDEEDLD